MKPNATQERSLMRPSLSDIKASRLENSAILTEAAISESVESMRVHIGATLLTISGDAREMIDIATVEIEILGLDREDAICALLGLGFEQRGTFSTVSSRRATQKPPCHIYA